MWHIAHSPLILLTNYSNKAITISNSCYVSFFHNLVKINLIFSVFNEVTIIVAIFSYSEKTIYDQCQKIISAFSYSAQNC